VIVNRVSSRGGGIHLSEIRRSYLAGRAPLAHPGWDYSSSPAGTTVVVKADALESLGFGYRHYVDSSAELIDGRPPLVATVVRIPVWFPILFTAIPPALVAPAPSGGKAGVRRAGESRCVSSGSAAAAP
jgi:hypothetical protein